MISVSYQGKRLSYTVLRSVPNTIMLRLCAVLLLSALMINDAWAQVAAQQASSQRSRGVEVSEVARIRIAEQIAAKRLEKEQGTSAAKSDAAQRVLANIRAGLQAAVDVPYEQEYFDTQTGNDFSFPEDTHDFCRASFGSDTANPDYYLDATINAGESLVVTLNWTASATFADYDLYLFDREGRPAGDPSGLFPNGTIGNNYQTDNSNLVEVASLTNDGADEAVIAVIDRFRGEAGSTLNVTFTGNDGVFSVLEFIGTDNLTYLNADVDGNGTDQTVGPLTDGLTISGDVASNFSAQFNTDGCAESVVFTLTDDAGNLVVLTDSEGNPLLDSDGNPINAFTDDDLPFAAFGDTDGNFDGAFLPPGLYVLTAESFSQNGGQGASGTELVASFEVIADPVLPTIDNFTLIDAASDQPIDPFNPIQEGDVIDLVDLFNQGFDISRLNIRANVTDMDEQILSVDTDLNITLVTDVIQPVSNSDDGSPYSVYGDDNTGDFSDAALPLGTYALSGVPVGAEGPFATATVNFTVIGPRIENYTLINAITDDPIDGTNGQPDFDPIPDGAVIDVNTLATNSVNIRANTVDYTPPSIESVQFDFQSATATIQSRSESFRPYALFGDPTSQDLDPPFGPPGDPKPDYNIWVAQNGDFVLSGIPYTENVAMGDRYATKTITFSITGGASPGAAPGTPEQLSNFPNPFNPVTTIRFGLAEAASVRLTVYDMLGREVKVLVDNALAEGSHEVSFEASGLSSGMYLYRLETPTGVYVRPMTLLK